LAQPLTAQAFSRAGRQRGRGCCGGLVALRFKSAETLKLPRRCLGDPNAASTAMSYIAHSLSASETLIYRARFPWFYTTRAWAILIASAIAAVATEWQGYGWMAALPLVVGVGLWLTILVPIWSTEIGVTNQRLIYKKGLLWRKTQELQLRAIEEVNLDQG